MSFNYTLEKHLPNDFPMDLINLISEFICDCYRLRCDFCNEYISCCYLKRCANCKKKTCGLDKCLNFHVDYLLTYADSHKVIKACHKCPECRD